MSEHPTLSAMAEHMRMFRRLRDMQMAVLSKHVALEMHSAALQPAFDDAEGGDFAESLSAAFAEREAELMDLHSSVLELTTAMQEASYAHTAAAADIPGHGPPEWHEQEEEPVLVQVPTSAIYQADSASSSAAAPLAPGLPTTAPGGSSAAAGSAAAAPVSHPSTVPSGSGAAGWGAPGVASQARVGGAASAAASAPMGLGAYSR